MARLPYVSPDEASSPELQQTFAQLPTVLSRRAKGARGSVEQNPIVESSLRLVLLEEEALVDRAPNGPAGTLN